MKKLLLITFSFLVFFATVFAVPATVQAATSKETVCNAIGSGADCSQNGGGDLSEVVRTIVNILSILIGIVAVIMIIIAGAKYITAGGDTNKITSAKNTLIYAIIGLIIVAVSQFLVFTVLKTTEDAVSFQSNQSIASKVPA